MKKAIIFILLGLLILTIAACNDDTTKSPQEQNTTQEQLNETDMDFVVDDEVQQRVDENREYNEVVYESEILHIKQISKHVYQHTSYLYGNIPCHGMFIVYENKAVVFDATVDDESSSELIDWITESLKSEIIAVIPTHYHIDNLGGLNEFHNRRIGSYAYDKTIQITTEHSLAVPQYGFNGYMELEIGDQKVYVEFMGEGHTVDNIIGYFPLENIMFGGCLIKALGDDKGNITEANVEVWSETVRNIKLKYPNVEKIIVGHGEMGGPELLDYTIDLFEQ